MSDAFIQLALFASKTLIIFLFIVSVLVVIIAIMAKGKGKSKGKLTISNLSHRYTESTMILLAETLPKKLFKVFLKENKRKEKEKAKSDQKPKTVYVLHFQGDIKASAVAGLSEEVNAILNVATPTDEVVVRLDSAGGVVHGYGLAAAQLLRIRARHIPLTVSIDKIAASGGYLMACVADKILSAPYAIIGSIGVVVQLPNFHRLLKNKQIDFEQLTAGEFKRTITLFGENTDEGREKLQHEIEDIHQLFKQLIKDHRQQVDIEKVATGEHWLGQQALNLKLVDDIKTGDDYLLERSKEAELFEIAYESKKPLLNRLTATAAQWLAQVTSFRLFA